jgi:hypothetical protein
MIAIGIGGKMNAEYRAFANMLKRQREKEGKCT